MTALTLPRALRSGALEFPVAAFAALATAFVAFAAPPELLAELVGLTGLPALLPAAQPPLGVTARLAIGLVGSGLVFAASFYALRALDRLTARPVRPAPPLAEGESPRLRRRDIHPDAPPVRPISPERDFGAPLEKVPAWLAPADTAEIELLDEIEHQPEAAPEPAAFMPPPLEAASLAELMARLEGGLARRAAPAVQTAALRPAPPPAAADDRLQSAIESLQRLTARQA